jgi:hypothetical protein
MIIKWYDSTCDCGSNTWWVQMMANISEGREGKGRREEREGKEGMEGKGRSQ